MIEKSTSPSLLTILKSTYITLTAETQVVVNGDSPVPIKTDTWYKLTLVVRVSTYYTRGLVIYDVLP